MLSKKELGRANWGISKCGSSTFISHTKRPYGSDCNDRFSKLPDELIYHILSFFLLRDVVMMSVVSKRWCTLCRSISFVGCKFDDPVIFWDIGKAFWNQIEPPPSELVPQQSLGITDTVIEGYNDLVHIKRWIDMLVQHKVEKLSLIFSLCKPFVLPGPASFYKSLKQLAIVLLNQPLVLPCHQHFCQLAVLELSFIKFSDDFSCWVSLLTSLHSLDISRCDGFSIFHLKSQQLEHLRFVDCKNKGDLDLKIDAVSLKTFHTEFPWIQNKSVELCAPNLTSLSWACCGVCRWSLGSLASLSKLYCRLTQDPNEKLVGRYESFCGFFQAVTHVKDLKINEGCIQALFEKFPRDPPLILANVESLQMMISLNDNNIQATAFLLKCSPNLKNLSIICNVKDTNMSWSKFKVAFWESQKLRCMRGLKTVKIAPYQGHGNDKALVKYINNHAHKLEKMDLGRPQMKDSKSSVFACMHGVQR